MKRNDSIRKSRGKSKAQKKKTSPEIIMIHGIPPCTVDLEIMPMQHPSKTATTSKPKPKSKTMPSSQSTQHAEVSQHKTGTRNKPIKLSRLPSEATPHAEIRIPQRETGTPNDPISLSEPPSEKTPHAAAQTFQREAGTLTEQNPLSFNMIDMMSSYGLTPSAEYLAATHTATVRQTTAQPSNDCSTSTQVSDAAVASKRLTFAELVAQKRIQQSSEAADETENVLENETLYFSANSSNSSNDLTEQEAKKRVVWKLERTFQSDKELQEYLKAEGCWSIRGSKEKTTQGMKTRYRCNRVKKSASQCAAALYALHLSLPESDSSIEDENPNPNTICIELYRTNAEHSCDNSQSKSSRISKDIQDIIIKKVQEGKTATAISFEMSEMDIELEHLPSVKQIRNVIQN